MQSVLLSPVQ